MYVQALAENRREAETESLDVKERFHELVLTSLRVRKGLSTDDVREEFGDAVLGNLLETAGKYIECEWLIHRDHHLKLSRQGLLFADKITSDLFVI